MQEIFDHSFSLINIIPTFLLFFCLLYWFTVLLGAIDLDFFDVDLDLDSDVDASSGFSAEWLNSILIFFNLAHVPLMVFATFFALSLWFISLIVNYYLGIEVFLIALLLLIPNIIISLLFAKFSTLPFVSLFSRLKNKKETSSQSLIGKVGTVLLMATETHLGQAEVKIDGSSFLVNTKHNSDKEILKGDKALIIDYDETNNIYYIESYTF